MTVRDASRAERMAWWHEAKFGMFVHWGCYSVLGRGEQVIVRDRMPLDEYRELADRFQPAADWADQVADQAVRAGTRYVVLTTRHHDGYCLFDTKTDPFNAAQTGPGRDLVAEYVEPLRNSRWKISGLPEDPPCDLAPVIKIEFAAPPYQLTLSGASWLDGDYEAKG